MLYGLTPSCTNDFMYYLAMIASFCMPLVGLFDEHINNPVHCVFAIGFFGGIGIYIFMLSG